DVDLVAQPDRAVFERRVESRMAPQGARDRMDHQIGVSELRLAPQMRAQVSGRGDVGLCAERELCRAVQAFHHVLGDRFANSLEGNDVAAALNASAGCGWRATTLRRAGLRRGGGAFDILARYPAAGTCARDP